MNEQAVDYATLSDAQLRARADEGDDYAGMILENRIRVLGPLEDRQPTPAQRAIQVSDALIALLSGIESFGERDSIRGRELLRMPEYLRARKLFDDD